MNATTPNIDTLLEWGPWTKKELRSGLPMLLRTATPSEAFWEVWRTDKDQLKRDGLSVGRAYKDETKWEVKQWRTLPAEAMAQLKANIAQSQALDTDQPIPVPEGLEYFGFQRAGIAFCRGKNGVLIADEMGCGKTIQAIGVINDDPTIKRVLIVCPANLKTNWYREVKRWLTRPEMQCWVAEPKMFPKADITICNYDILTRFPAQLAREFDLVVADECHYAKGGNKVKRAKALFSIPARRRIGLTGTPIVNRPQELFPIVHWLDPVEFDSFYRFAYKYCGAQRGAFGMEFDTEKANLANLHRKLRSTCFTGDTFVACEHGNITIRDIVKRNLRVRVWSVDPMGCLSLKPVVGVRAIQNRKAIVEVVHAFGKVRCTLDHPIFTESKGWVRAGELTSSDQVLVLRKEHRENSNTISRQNRKTVERTRMFNDMRRQTAPDASQARLQEDFAGTSEIYREEMRSLSERVRCFESSNVQSQTILQPVMSRHLVLQTVRKTGAAIRAQSSKVRSRQKRTPFLKERQTRSSGNAGTTRANVNCSEASLVRESRSIEGSRSDVEANAKAQFDAQENAGTYPIGFSSRHSTGVNGCDDSNGGVSDICGYSDSQHKDHRGGGWGGSCQETPAKAGQTERPSTSWSGIRSVTRLELGSGGNVAGDSLEDTCVYDIEVADSHNFFANGVLAHNCMVRRLKKDVLGDLPEMMYRVAEIDAPEIIAQIKQECAGYEAAMGGRGRVEALQAAIELAKVSESEAAYREAVQALSSATSVAFTEMSAIRAALAHAKIPYAVEHLGTLLENEIKVVSFSHHRELIEAIRAAFPRVAVTHYGGMTDTAKQDGIDRFQRDDACLLFNGSIQASGVGLTLTASSHGVMVEQDWTPGNMAQCSARMHRIGQKSAVMIEHLVFKDSLDANMARTHVEKQTIIEKALDNDRDKLVFEPVAPRAFTASAPTAQSHVSVRRQELDEQAKQMTPQRIEAVQLSLRLLAGVCDGARARDMAGFNGVDAAIGRDLANRGSLSPKAAALGSKICRKYKRQLPEDLWSKL